MHRSKIIKKRTKHRETLLRNLRKGKARLEERATFQLIPYPTKFSKALQMHRLYAVRLKFYIYFTSIAKANIGLGAYGTKRYYDFRHLFVQ